MKILITKPTIVGGVAVEAGETVEANDRDARHLIALGKAVEAPVKKRSAKKETATAKTDQETRG